MIYKSLAVLTAITLQSACTAHMADPDNLTLVPVAMGDGMIDAAPVKPYEFTWTQCAFQDGVWSASPPLTETASLTQNGQLKVSQSNKGPGGGTAVTSFYFSPALSPQKMTQTVHTASGDQLADVTFTFTETGYTGEIKQGEASQTKTGDISQAYYHGGMLGLALLSLDFDKADYEFDSAMVGMGATYKTTASRAGTDTLSFNGEDITAELIDITWRHDQSGDVYEPGPNGSGGRYWLVKNPPEGFPYVPRYQTDTYAIEFVPGVCPAS